MELPPPDTRESPGNHCLLQKPEGNSGMNWDPELEFLGCQAGLCLMRFGAPCHDASSTSGGHVLGVGEVQGQGQGLETLFSTNASDEFCRVKLRGPVGQAP